MPPLGRYGNPRRGNPVAGPLRGTGPRRPPQRGALDALRSPARPGRISETRPGLARPLVDVLAPGPTAPVAGAPPVGAPPAAAAAPQRNPYTGKPLGANEYVGVAGSESEHPGMTRIPPPGWWDPSNPNYERRNYYVDPSGHTVAREPGYFNPDNPFDTGRENETQGEYRGFIPQAGQYDRRMSEPGVPGWGPGIERKPPGALVPAQTAGVSTPRGQGIWGALLGGPTEPQGSAGWQDIFSGMSQAQPPGVPGQGQAETLGIPEELLAAILGLAPGRRPRGLVE